ncbi:zinc ABC transporter substrate-binding protein [Betaproteobacteria bacterium]|nr:zinc ABC transporter substrate-binding protein [Betaproteobacteria bacterium]GHU11282.1 zinc ABC transporter substrate-binding protein [Betaproteobacteria bacterium]
MQHIQHKIQRVLALLFCLCVLPVTASAKVSVLATVPEWGALAQEIGGERVDIFTATSARQDPHRIEARPSLIARARNADLLIATGAELEIGWLPVLLRESGNTRIQPGQPGHLEAAGEVVLRDVPQAVDRSMGDVHAAGDPHFHLDPHNILPVAAALTERLARIDPAGVETYRSNLARFRTRWQEALVRWEAAGAKLKGTPFLQVHRSFGYLAHWLGLVSRGELEPKPGIEPGSAHLSRIVTAQQTSPAALILRAAYQDETAGRWVAERAQIPLVTLPFTVGGTPEAKDLFSLFDDTLARLEKAAGNVEYSKNSPIPPRGGGAGGEGVFTSGTTP